MGWLFKINRSEKYIRICTFLCSLTPLFHLLYGYYTNQLGINLFATISHSTGHLALIFILLTLAVTPTRRLLCNCACKLNMNRGKRLADWNFLIRCRRQLGLFGFFYATLHLMIYFSLDIYWQWEFFTVDLKERSFIVLGLINFVMLLSLAITSYTPIRKKMGNMAG